MRKLPAGLRDPLDYDTLRSRVYDSALEGLQTRYPLENDRYRLELNDIKYEGPETFSLSEQKDAILRRKTLGRPISGKWTLVDKQTETPVQSKRAQLASIPHLTQRGTYIIGGNEYTVANQMRLRSGVYTRKRASGEPEAHFNILRGGPGFRVRMDPKTGAFSMHVGQAKLNLYPLLKSMGVEDRDIATAWGRDLMHANAVAAQGKHEATMNKVWKRLARATAKQGVGEEPERDLRKLLEGFEMDGRVSERTLGKAFDRVTPEAIMTATRKLVAINKGQANADNRDSLEFQDLWSAEDFISERFTKDSGRLGSKALWRATLRGNLNAVTSGMLQPQVDSLFMKSGLAQPLEEVNIFDAIDQNTRVLRIGEGGMSQAAVPDEARNVQPSHFMFIDPVRGPESAKIGVDSRIAYDTYKGADRRAYSRFQDAKGADVFLSPEQATESTIAFPGEVERAKKEGRKRLKTMSGGRIQYKLPQDVDYYAPAAQGMFTLGSNVVPALSGIKGGRLLMGAKMATQALPMRKPEAPLVRAASPDGKSFEAALGSAAGAVRAKSSGRVISVDDNAVRVEYADGTQQTFDLYNNFPLNRKTQMHSRPLVKPGDAVKKGQLLAVSNFTDDDGVLALGKNLRVAYMPYRGLNFEDAVVVSESAARNLASEHMYTEKLDFDDLMAAKKSKFISLYPKKFTVSQLAKIGDDGVAEPGQILEKGDPLMLAVRRQTSRGAGMLYRGAKASHTDDSRVWKHEFPGIVTDKWVDKAGAKVAVKAFVPMEVGDKLSGRYGDKGIVSKIVSDDKMPRDAEGRPVDIVVNPLGVISRVNPSQVAEAVLGKIAEKTGKPYEVPAFMDESLVDYAISELEKHGMSDTETVEDPVLGKSVPGVLVGNRYYLKLHHTVESKHSQRGLGAYTQEGLPARSLQGNDKPKRVGLGEMSALLAHGAVENIRELRTLKGQRNDDFWRAYMAGRTPPQPGVPNAYKKMIAHMRGAGINVKRDGDYLHLTAMTDKDVDSLSAGEIKSPDLVRWTKEYGRGTFGEQSMEPVTGGLFDRGVTGGHGGNRYGHITLSEPMPQPTMEDPIRNMLGMTKKKYESVIAGREAIPGVPGTGGAAVREALRRIDIDTEIARAKDEAGSSRNASVRDKAIKRLKFLRNMQKQGMRPEDLVVTKVPVIPPIFRPVTATSKFTLVSGPNRLYIDLMNANDNLRKLADIMDGDPVADSRLNVYRAMRAVSGLGDPINPETEAKGARGLLKDIFGSSPKLGAYQRQLIGTAVDFSARSTIIPNPELNMDEIGLPESQAWDLYAPFVVRRIVRSMGGGKGAQAAAVRMVANKEARAKEALLKEMAERPVLSSRAPALHKYSIMAFMPKIAPGKAIELAPPIVTGFNADFDGDNMNFHVVVSDEAVQEAKEKMLPSVNLRSPSDFDVMWAPRQEFLHGLYQATTKKDARRMLPKFKSAADALKAYARGDAEVQDVVSIAD